MAPKMLPLPLADGVTAVPANGLPSASSTVTVSVVCDVPSAMTVVSLATSEEVAADGGPARMLTVVLASSAPNVAVGVMAPAWLERNQIDGEGPVRAGEGKLGQQPVAGGYGQKHLETR